MPPNISSVSSSSWIKYRVERPDSKYRLFCFPYAGGGATSFLNWTRSFNQEIEVCPIQLPGRQERMGESAIINIRAMIKELEKVLLPLFFDKPFVLFGHSMGSIIAFELARCLEAKHGISPECLIVSGKHSPTITQKRTPICDLPDAPFIEELRKLNGTPENVLNNVELMSLILPCLRSDFKLVETYSFQETVPLNCDLFAFFGSNDEGNSPLSVSAWSDTTQKKFKLYEFEGDHFFLHSNEVMVRNHIENIILGRADSELMLECL